MWEVICEKCNDIWNDLIVKGGILISLLLTMFLSAIGYPKQIILFIIVLIPIDILAKWYATVVQQYGYLSLYTFFRAWKDKHLTSRKLKNGLFVKLFFYSIFLYIAHQCSTSTELAFGKAFSNLIYSSLVVLDLISIAQHAIDAGFSNAQVFLKYLKNKSKQIMGEKESSK